LSTDPRERNHFTRHPREGGGPGRIWRPACAGMTNSIVEALPAKCRAVSASRPAVLVLTRSSKMYNRPEVGERPHATTTVARHFVASCGIRNIALGWLSCSRQRFRNTLGKSRHSERKHPEFIVAWLGIKTVVRWRHWENDIAISPADGKGEPTWIYGRHAYNLFLIGNALVIVYAGAGWLLIDPVRVCDWSMVITLFIAVILGSISLVCVAGATPDYPPRPGDDPNLQRNSGLK
jgi:hypothetical protein